MSLQVMLFHNQGVYDDLIRFDEISEGSKYTHVALLVDGIRVLEAFPGVGVRKRDIARGSEGAFDLCAITGVTPQIEAKVMAFFESTKGLPYDWIGIAAFALGRSDDSYNSFFCSKWVFEALRASGLPLLLRITCGRVRPSELSLSTLLPPAP